MRKANTTLIALGLTAAVSLPFSTIAKSKADLPLDEIRNFVDVYNTIRKQYVEEKDGKILIDYAIKGMLNGLDPHSIYLPKEELDEFKNDTTGSYQGFGFRLELVNGKLLIISAIANSPAEKAGLKPHDLIIKIGDTVIDNMSMKEIDNLLKDDTIKLTIIRKGEDKQVELTKSTVQLPSVTDKVLEKDYGYIRVSQFQLETANEFEQALKKLLKKNIKGLVIDLRNNPGGFIASATAIADMFLDAGLIVSTKNQNTNTEDKIHADKDTIAKDLPLVVLINEGSASASELLAGALQSHKRGVIVGRRSFGKGSVQEVISLDNGNAIKLTIARYYTPSGESIQAKGITPDIVLSQLTVEDKDENPFSYGEADIPKHLDNNDDNSDKSDEQSDGEGGAEQKSEKSDTSDKNSDGEKSQDEKKDSTKDKSDKKSSKKSDKPSDKKDNKNKKESKENASDDELDAENTEDTDENAVESVDNSDSQDEATRLAKSDLQLFEALNVLKVLIFKQ